MSDVGEVNAMGDFGIKLRFANPEVDGEKWFITEEILYWDTKVGGTEYALSVAEFTQPLRSPVKGSIKFNDFGWDLGEYLKDKKYYLTLKLGYEVLYFGETTSV